MRITKEFYSNGFKKHNLLSLFNSNSGQMLIIQQTYVTQQICDSMSSSRGMRQFFHLHSQKSKDFCSETTKENSWHTCTSEVQNMQKCLLPIFRPSFSTIEIAENHKCTFITTLEAPFFFLMQVLGESSLLQNKRICIFS